MNLDARPTFNPDDYVRGQILGCELAFKCPQQWKMLARTSHQRVRHCPECQKEVVYCTTPLQVQRVAARSGCVAFWGGAGDPITGEVRVVLGRPTLPGLGSLLD